MIRFDSERGRVDCELDDLFDRPARPDGPDSHQTFSATLEWSGLEVRIGVRVDALRGAQSAVVPECGWIAGPESEPREAALERLGLAALLLRRSGQKVKRARLIERSPDGRELGRIDLTVAERPWTRRLHARLAARVRPARAAAAQRRDRAELAEALRFPFSATRPGQEALMRDVQAAAEGGLRLLVAAPTGLGKTAAAIFPLLRCALREGRQLFFATAKVSQQELALATLKRLLPPGSPAHAVQISARQRICAGAAPGCSAHGPPGARCALRRDFENRLARSGLESELAALGVIDTEALAERALAVRLCPFDVSLALARSASAIVGDFNYVFDPRARLALHAGTDDSEQAKLLIVDEAHNLVERARGYFSPELVHAELARVSAALRPLRARAYRAARELLEEAMQHLGERAARLAEERAEPPPWVDAPERSFWVDLEQRGSAALAEYLVQAAGERSRPEALRALAAAPESEVPSDPLLAALQAVLHFARCAGLDPDRSACIWRPEGARIVCLDPAAWLTPIWSEFHALVCMSATLAPFEFYRAVLGLEGPRTEQLDLPSPFPEANRLLVAVDSVDTTWRHREDDAGRIAAMIARCTSLRAGNYLAFFPSFRFRDAVVAKLPPGGPRVLLQLPGMPAKPVLQKLAQNRGGTLLVCGVAGGVLAEGVDYPGDLAIGVFVVGPSLPAVSLEQELIREYYQRQLGQGFDYAYLFPGLSRAVQAGGRALRTPADRAAIVLLCRRFSEPMYRERLPAWWRAELLHVSDPVPALRAFWAAQQEAERSC